MSLSARDVSLRGRPRCSFEDFWGQQSKSAKPVKTATGLQSDVHTRILFGRAGQAVIEKWYHKLTGNKLIESEMVLAGKSSFQLVTAERETPRSYGGEGKTRWQSSKVNQS